MSDEAVELYTQAIEINPLKVEFYLARGHSYYRLERYWEAIRDYDRFLQCNRSQALLWNMRGLAK